MAGNTGSTGSRIEPGMTTDFKDRMDYGSYLGLDLLLAAQKPLSDAPDELLFITIHQVQELWLKLATHELDGAIAALRNDELQPAFKSLARVSRIQAQLISAWDVLSTMTPADYLAFRDALGQSSGFQSYQYRALEFRLGAKDPRMLAMHQHHKAHHAHLEALLAAPSLYDEALRLLARHGLPIPAECLERDWRQPHVSNPAVRAAWLTVYRDTHRYFDLYELAEELVDVEDQFQQWRFRHMKTVERIIGFKPGTGGSSGVKFLRTALERSFFPELWELRSEL
ncbi:MULTISPECIES: tryptophan 2,3-dioxygenase [Bosea]|jgi:tryptophan 2,3-dioxygenase|uniref:Tryptophan 2,3-dioxygenase n=1 Tax=Bosea rubneri TaxID=3075434 RepID=A0ABU3S1Y2_9HYPH|nr:MULTISPECIES: tryptophan 2,3-dioxygenase [unclassified Bosea (in: a-proteobacteria)]MDU0338799.1 tryptophan 2,3-dioxygenase [Bosea sp. ZW T0_25]HEV7334859.1 tryptophan 2,3-dioxygenase [Bosea sp. (in: a-proteobacteria)]